MQLSYSKEMAVGLAGQIAGTFEPKKIVSLLAEGADLAVGVPVELGTDAAKQCVALTAVDNFFGVSVLPLGKEQDAAGAVKYKADTMAAVMQMGRIFVTASAAVAAGVEVVPATSGKFAAGTSDAAVKAFAVSAAAADGDLFMIELTGLQGTPAT